MASPTAAVSSGSCKLWQLPHGIDTTDEEAKDKRLGLWGLESDNYTPLFDRLFGSKYGFSPIETDRCIARSPNPS